MTGQIVLLVPDPAEPALGEVALRVAAFGVALLALSVVGAVLLLEIDDWRAARRRKARQAARQVAELEAQRAERAARPARTQHVLIRPDIAGPLPRAQAWRDVAVLSEREGEFR